MVVHRAAQGADGGYLIGYEGLSELENDSNLILN
jgi:hypothetical protein